MLGPPKPQGPRSGQRRGLRTVLITCVVVVGLLLLTTGLPSGAFTTGEFLRDTNVPVVGEDSETNAAHGLDKASTATNGTTDPLVNVSNNFGTGSEDLEYRVKLLNNTGSADLNVSGTNQENSYDFVLSSSDPEEKINITTDFAGTPESVKYSVNVTNQTLTVNATRTVEVTS